jgi:hypothetical protein
MQITPRDRRILQITGVVVPLLLAYFFVLRPDGGEDLALPSGPTGITGSTGVPTESPAGSRDPFSIPPGLELSTGGSVSPMAPEGRHDDDPGTTTLPSVTSTRGTRSADTT